MRATPSIWNRDIFKAGLVVAGLLIPYHWYLVRWETLSSATFTLGYSALLTLCLVATLAAAFSQSIVFRLGCAVLFAASVLLVDSYQRVMDAPFFYVSFVNLFETASFTGDALEQFGGHIVPPIVAALLIATGVIVPPRPRAYRYRIARHIPAMAPVVAMALLATIVFARDGAGATGMPGTIVTGAYGAVMVTEKVLQLRQKRQPVTIAHKAMARPADIVLIIDESVRGDYLDIGGGNIRSGLLSTTEQPLPGVYNFGRAASAANCSAGTNITLRYGGTRANYLRYIATKPTIWSYAKEAGYHTVYMDAQLTDGRLQNSMTKRDLQKIDEFIQFDHTPVVDRDEEIAKLIVQRTHNDTPEFIVANKIGAHFPVNDKYPDSYMIYKPASPRGRLANVAAVSGSTGAARWDLYKNAYRNTLLWSVGHFMDTILGGANLSNAVIFYTSDHGQNFHEDGSPGYATHCSQDPPPSEGTVAIAMMTKVPDVAKEAATWSRDNYGATSHFDIFPTLLDLMNYDTDEVRLVYGPSLFEPTNDPLTFNARFSEFGGNPPYWVHIKPLGPTQSVSLR